MYRLRPSSSKFHAVFVCSALSSDMYRLRQKDPCVSTLQCSALSSDMYRLRRIIPIITSFVSSALSSDMYRLRLNTSERLAKKLVFCIKQRYVSIKTLDIVTPVWPFCSALSSDMYRLRQKDSSMNDWSAQCSALSSDMYRLRQCAGSNSRCSLCSALSSDMYRLRQLTSHYVLFQLKFCIKQRYVSIKT